jgi:hypothetical protein
MSRTGSGGTQQRLRSSSWSERPLVFLNLSIAKDNYPFGKIRDIGFMRDHYNRQDLMD